MTMRRSPGDLARIVHDAKNLRLEAVVTHHPISGATFELHSTWPMANHPEPHRMITLTLPPESFANLARVLAEAAAMPGPGRGR